MFLTVFLPLDRIQMKHFKDFYRLFEIPVTPEQMVEGLSKGWKTPFRDELDSIEIEKRNKELMEQLVMEEYNEEYPEK